MDTAITQLNDKVDILTSQMAFITEQMEAQQRRHQEMEELKQDFIPIGNQLLKLTIDELAEIGNDFELEDILFLGKRVLRDTHMFITLLDRLESTMGLVDEAELLGQQVFNNLVKTLEDLENQGYFSLANGLSYIGKKVVDEFGEEDVVALGDNIVSILKTVRNLTQPEILGFANNMVGAIQDEPEIENPSTWALIKEFSDPKTRKGLARLLNLVKVIADQPGSTQN